MIGTDSLTSIAKAVAGATLRAAYESLSQAEDSDGADEDDDDGDDDEGSGKSDQELHASVYLRVLKLILMRTLIL